MEFVLIRHELSKQRYSEMTQHELNNIVNFYNGYLIDIEEDYNDKIILVISAPSTWKTLVLSSLLIPYRFV